MFDAPLEDIKPAACRPRDAWVLADSVDRDSLASAGTWSVKYQMKGHQSFVINADSTWYTRGQGKAFPESEVSIIDEPRVDLPPPQIDLRNAVEGPPFKPAIPGHKQLTMLSTYCRGLFHKATYCTEAHLGDTPGAYHRMRR